jgi:riboflavin kinase/FMN adenylyltransferase
VPKSLESYLSGLDPGRDTVLTIGVFDGVHLGHQFLLDQLKRQAVSRGLLAGVVTFDQHPEEVLGGIGRLPWLTDAGEKENIIRNLGIGLVATIPFNARVAGLDASQFVGLLVKHLRMKGLVVGPDFALGRGRQGDMARLRTLGQEMGFTVDSVPPMVLDSAVVSSTAVRQALADGDVRKFRRLVGRYFSLRGEVSRGARRGTGLGFPTANLSIDSRRAMPADGVYATWAYLEDIRHPSATNVGVRPTFDNGQRLAEVYILDYHGSDLYGHQLRIELVDRLREERRFASVEELKAQMAQDVAEARVVLDAEVKER